MQITKYQRTERRLEAYPDDTGCAIGCGAGCLTGCLLTTILGSVLITTGGLGAAFAFLCEESSDPR